MHTTGTHRRHLLAAAWLMPAAAHAQPGPPDLAGRQIELQVRAVGPCRASQIAAEMATAFAAYARAERGYDARLTIVPEPALPDQPWSADTHLVLAPTPLLAALAAPKWIVPLNTLIRARPALDVAWYAPVVRESFQLFPESSANRWAIPQSGDALVLFVRQDLLDSDAERAAFRAATGTDLPRSFTDFEALTWDRFRPLLTFFHRPAQDLAGWVAPMPADVDAFAAAALSYLLGAGGQLWDPATATTDGVLNTRANAEALAAYLDLLAFQPPGAAAWTLADSVAHFAAGRAFAALQWASAGAALIPPAMAGKVAVVPPPGFLRQGQIERRSVVGGRLWAVNAAADPLHRQAAADLLDWWCRPDTQSEFIRRGGLPCDQASLAAPAFDAAQPWHRAYKLMLLNGADFWRDPRYADLLQAQQDMLRSALAGDPVAHALQRAACRQQAILFQEGSANQRPGPDCREP